MSIEQDIVVQLRRLRQTGFAALLSQQAEANGFTPAFFFAIASRETNCVNELGDIRADGAHGIGIVQVDAQHVVAREARDSGSWQTNPAPLIAFAAQLLAQNIRQARETFPELPGDGQLKIAASGYNCGMGNAIAGQRNGNCDERTTGHNYGADVMARKELFEKLMAQPAATAASAAA
jgi:hypothetical protein